MAWTRAIDTLPTLLLLGRALGHEPAAASNSAAPATGPLDWPLLVTLASNHLVTPALQPRLERVAGPLPDSELHRYFDVMRSLNGARNRRIRAQLEHIVEALNAVGIEPVLLKGTAHLLSGLYADDADRVIGDIDLLVADEQRDEALAALFALDYAHGEAGEEHAHLHHYPPLARSGSEAWIELHKIASPHRRALPTNALIQRARAIRIGKGSAAVPCPEDLLIHNIVHSQLHNRGFWSAEFSLRAAYDLVLLSRRFRGDWLRLAARIDADVGKQSAGFYVHCAHRLFGQAPPPLAWPLGARLCERRWRLHARGKMLWLRRLTRMVTYELALVSEIISNPAWRGRLIRCLLDVGWYRQHVRRVRSATGIEPLIKGANQS